MSVTFPIRPDVRALARHQELMERFLSTQRRVMLTYLAHRATGAGVHLTRAGSAASAPLAQRPAADAAVRRCTLQLAALPAATANAALARDGVIVVVDDGRGVAAALAARLRHGGSRVAVLQPGGGPSEDEQIHRVDLDSLSDIERAVARLRNGQGRVSALVHLLALEPCPDLAAVAGPAWSARLARETRSLFLLAKSLHADLNAAAQDGGAAILAATAMGGTFGLGSPSSLRVFPGQGAIGGLVKTLALEHAGVRARVVDVDPREGADSIAAELEAELWHSDDETEVGYADGKRTGIRLVSSDLRREVALTPDADWVWLVTGGARGITAEICCELAERYRSTFVLVGQSPLPPPEEDADTAGLTDMAQVKAGLIRRLRAQGQPVTPAQVDRAYQHLLKAREIRANLAALARSGARVRYVSLDVRDDVAFGALVDGIYQSFGRLDGVLHGAGIIEDKLVRDKTVDSFDRVVATKVQSAFVLSRRLRPESLRVLVFFTSVAGRFGNRGQADYAAANEVLTKLAWHLDREWPGRVVAINWGPWDKLGMVSAELRAEFHRRGVRLVPAAEGRQALDAEIRRGRKGEAEVVVGDGPWGGVWQTPGGATVDAARTLRETAGLRI